MKQVNIQRRKWLSLGGIVLGATVLPSKVLASISTPAPLQLRFRNVNTGDTHTARFSNTNPSAGLTAGDFSKLNWLMRDRHINKSIRMDPNLFFKLNQIQRRLGMRNAEVMVLSGYRSAQTNAAMRRRSRGVASNSYHIKGQAVDFYISGVPLAKVKTAAESLAHTAFGGGVGYYPRSNFVHVDTGPVRSWRG